MSDIYIDPLSELDLICFTLRFSANENLAQAESTEDKYLYLGEIRAYNKIRDKIKELKERA